MMLRRSIAATILLLTFPTFTTLYGCGSGANPGAIVQSGKGVGTVTLTIVWPAQTRLIPAVTRSISAILNLGSTTLASQLVTPPAIGSVSTVSFNNLQAGSMTLYAAAYPNSDGSGVALASGSSPVSVIGSRHLT